MRRRRQAGFSLVEVLVALTIVVVGFMAVLQSMASMHRNRARSDELSMATILAEEKLEAIKSLDFDQVVSASEGFGNIPGYAGYKRTTTVTAQAGGAYKEVSVRVEGRRANKPYELVTYIAP